jgi:hypothetical protein
MKSKLLSKDSPTKTEPRFAPGLPSLMQWIGIVSSRLTLKPDASIGSSTKRGGIVEKGAVPIDEPSGDTTLLALYWHEGTLTSLTVERTIPYGMGPVFINRSFSILRPPRVPVEKQNEIAKGLDRHRLLCSLKIVLINAQVRRHCA